MIRLIENNLTKKKNVLNFIDNHGKVLGFNPEPDGLPICWVLYDEFLNDICCEEECSKFLPDFLNNLPYTFGEHIVSKCEQNSDGKKEELSIHLIPDDPSKKSLLLIVEFFAQGFYTAEFSLNPEDKEIFDAAKLTRVNSPEEIDIAKLLAEYDSTITEIQEKLSSLKNIKTNLIKIFANKERFLH